MALAVLGACLVGAGCQAQFPVQPPEVTRPSMAPAASARPPLTPPTSTPVPPLPLPSDCPQPVDTTAHAAAQPKPILPFADLTEPEPLGPSKVLAFPQASWGYHQLAFNKRSRQYLTLWEQTDIDPLTQTGSQRFYGLRLNEEGGTIGTMFRVVPETEYQAWPSLAINADTAESLVTWNSSNGLDSRVFARRLDRLGDPLGAPVPVSETIGTQSTALYNPNDREYLVVWSDPRSTGRHCPYPPSTLYGQRLREDGTPIGENFPLVPTYTNHWSYSVAHNAVDDEYLVVWGTTHSASLYVQRLDKAGARVGDVIVIPTASWPGRPLSPKVAHHPRRNEFLVAWADERHGDEDIYGLRLGREGLPVGESFPIGVSKDTQRPDRVAYHAATGEYLVTWRREVAIPMGNGESLFQGRLEGRMVRDDGTLPGQEFRLDAGRLGVVVQPHPEKDEHLILATGPQMYTQRVRLPLPRIEPMGLENVKAPASGEAGQPVLLQVTGIHPDGCWGPHEVVARVDDEKRDVRLEATQRNVAQVCGAAVGYSE